MGLDKKRSRSKATGPKGRKLVLDERFSELFTDEAFTKRIEKDIFHGGQLSREESTLLDPTKSLVLDEEAQAKVDAQLKSRSSNKDDDRFRWDESSTDDEQEETTKDPLEEARAELVEGLWEGEKEVIHGDASNRLSILGCDWDNVSAIDILVLCHSCVKDAKCIPVDESNPRSDLKSQAIDKVKIYPSEFGHKRMEHEKIHGPDLKYLELIKQAQAERTLDASEMSAETALAIRAYERERSNYFYAVVECASVNIANAVYDELDGMDADFAVNGLDVRFVPDDIQEFPFEPKTEALCFPLKYKAPVGTNVALKHSKARLYWDEAPAKKKKILRKHFTDKEMAELDVKDYLASTSEEDDDDDDKQDAGQGVDNYRRLLLGVDPAQPMKPSADETEDSSPFFVHAAPKKKESDAKSKQRSPFELLNGGKAEESEDESEAGEGQSSEDEAGAHKNTRRRLLRRSKGEEKEEVVSMAEIEGDERFAELFRDPKHFVDVTEKPKAEKVKRRKTKKRTA